MESNDDTADVRRSSFPNRLLGDDYWYETNQSTKKRELQNDSRGQTLSNKRPRTAETASAASRNPLSAAEQPIADLQQDAVLGLVEMGKPKPVANCEEEANPETAEQQGKFALGPGTQNTWDAWYSLLVEFQKQNGHARVPPGDKDLFTWVELQKARYRKSRNLLNPSEVTSCITPMTTQQFYSLRELQVDLLGPLDDSMLQILKTSNASEPQMLRPEKNWDDYFSELKAFKAEYKHLAVPRTSKHKSLYHWLRKQRYRYLCMKNLPIPNSVTCSPLSLEEYEKLKELGVDFDDTVGPTTSNSWKEKFTELEEFKTRYRHVDVPGTSEYKSLYHWVRRQRYRYLCMKNLPLPESVSCSPLNLEEYEKLKELGVDFDNADHDHKSWEDSFAELKAFKATNNHVDVPRASGYTSLHVWLKRQEYRYCRMRNLPIPTSVSCSPLSLEEYKKLKELGVDFDNADHDHQSHKSWEDSFAELKVFKATNNHVDVPRASGYMSLYHWVRRQRYRYLCMKNLPLPESYSCSPLSLEEYEKLKELGVDLENADRYQANWEKYFTELKAFKTKNNHVIVPYTGEYKSLADWVKRQRVRYRRMKNLPVTPSAQLQSRLSQEEYKKLKGLGVDFDNPDHDHKSWEDFFAELKVFKATNNHVDVPGTSEYNSLYHWVRRQRYRYCRMKNLPVPESINCSPLSLEEYKKLKELGVEFDDPSIMPVERPNDRDVLFGRGYAANFHPGNVLFRDIVSQLRGVFVCTTSRTDRRAISRSIVHSISRGPLRGRFLKENPEDGLWYDVSDSEAVRKTSQALREVPAREKSTRDSTEWECRYIELKKFHKQYGHIHVPFEANQKLHCWLEGQKERFKKGEHYVGPDSTLRSVQKCLLVGLGVSFGDTTTNTRPSANECTPKVKHGPAATKHSTAISLDQAAEESTAAAAAASSISGPPLRQTPMMDTAALSRLLDSGHSLGQQGSPPTESHQVQGPRVIPAAASIREGRTGAALLELTPFAVFGSAPDAQPGTNLVGEAREALGKVQVAAGPPASNPVSARIDGFGMAGKAPCRDFNIARKKPAWPLSFRGEPVANRSQVQYTRPLQAQEGRRPQQETNEELGIPVPGQVSQSWGTGSVELDGALKLKEERPRYEAAAAAPTVELGQAQLRRLRADEGVETQEAGYSFSSPQCPIYHNSPSLEADQISRSTYLHQIDQATLRGTSRRYSLPAAVTAYTLWQEPNERLAAPTVDLGQTQPQRLETDTGVKALQGGQRQFIIITPQNPLYHDASSLETNQTSRPIERDRIDQATLLGGSSLRYSPPAAVIPLQGTIGSEPFSGQASTSLFKQERQSTMKTTDRYRPGCRAVGAVNVVRVREARRNDVLLTSTPGLPRTFGDQRFFELISIHSRAYQMARADHERLMCCRQVVEEVLSLQPPGLFLVESEDGVSWICVDDEDLLHYVVDSFERFKDLLH